MYSRCRCPDRKIQNYLLVKLEFYLKTGTNINRIIHIYHLICSWIQPEREGDKHKRSKGRRFKREQFFEDILDWDENLWLHIGQGREPISAFEKVNEVQGMEENDFWRQLYGKLSNYVLLEREHHVSSVCISNVFGVPLWCFYPNSRNWNLKGDDIDSKKFHFSIIWTMLITTPTTKLRQLLGTQLFDIPEPCPMLLACFSFYFLPT